jgi:hypothetical protein
MMVSDVLVIAASALTKIRAERLNPLGRANDHPTEPGSIEAFSVFYYLGLDSFSIDGEWDKNDFSVEPSDPGAAKCDVLNV